MSCTPSSLSSGSLPARSSLSPTLPPSLSNPLVPSPPPPLLSAVDALLTYSMDSGGEGEEGWMEDQWEKWYGISLVLSLCFVFFIGMLQHGWHDLVSVIPNMPVFILYVVSLKLRAGMPLKESGCLWLCVYVYV